MTTTTTMISHPSVSQQLVPHGATACTAIAALFGLWAAESSDVPRMPFDEIVEVGGLLWKSVRDRSSKAYLQTEEVLQHETVRKCVGAIDTICGSLLPLATADASYSPHYARIGAALEKLREGNAGVFTFHDHSIGVATRSRLYYLFDSFGPRRSTLACFPTRGELERYVLSSYADCDSARLLSDRVVRSRFSPVEDSELACLANKHAFTFVVFEVKPVT